MNEFWISFVPALIGSLIGSAIVQWVNYNREKRQREVDKSST